MRATEFIYEAETYQPPELTVGDKILKGKFKNSPAEIKGFTKDKHNQPVLKTNKGEVQLFKPRVAKLMKEDSAVTNMSAEDMIAYLRQHHDTNLHQDYLDHINTFSKFVLTDIPVNSIKTDLPKLDTAKVEQYKKMDFSKAPPIVMGGGYILDGYHRANVAKALGIPTIKGYVGVQGTPKEQVVTELFDPTTAFPLKWDKQFAGQGEFHAEAYDADGRIIGISFTPVGDGNATEVVFTRGGTHEMTGKGDAARVMATVINAINIFIQKYKPPYLVFSAKSSGGRASAYTAMIRRVARGYKLLTPEEYPEELGSYFEFMGSDQPFVLART
jgi:hypothetical protein